MNENKHERKKKRTSEDVNTTTRLQKHNNTLSYCNLTNVSIEYFFCHCYFSYHYQKFHEVEIIPTIKIFPAAQNCTIS